MGLFKNLIKTIENNGEGMLKEAVMLGAAKGLRNSQLNSLLNTSSSDVNNNNLSFDISPVSGNDFSLFGLNTPTSLTPINYPNLASRNILQPDNTRLTTFERNDYQKNYFYGDNEKDRPILEYDLNLPNWNYLDFINERNVFVKHLSNGYDEPGWFYFKVFFDFSTNFGLFGGIMNSIDLKFTSINSATDYLLQCKELFKYEKLEDRILCLQRFTRLLSYININAPWFFKSIKNLSSVLNPNIGNINSDDQYIEIELDQDAVDMRISTLLSLYKYVCYDEINNKEILPENLRKFDLCILLFEAPIKFIHNVEINGKPKSVFNNNNTTNAMSFKLYRFMNCEIDITSLGGYVNGDIKNEQPFALGQNSLKIKFDRVFEYTMNEFMGLMFGSDGLYLDSSEIKVRDINNLTILSEKFIHNNINNLLKGNERFVLGNIFGQDRAIYKKNISNLVDSKVFTDYAKHKFGIMNSNKNILLNTGYNILYKLLGTGYNANAEVLRAGGKVIGDGTVLNGHGNYRVGSLIWREKMHRLLTGDTTRSNRENLLYVTGTALHTNWMQNLSNYAVNKINPIKI